MARLLVTPEDLPGSYEPGTPEYERALAACAYVSAVVLARYPHIPEPTPDAVVAVCAEVTTRYLSADPASGAYISETIGAYSYRRAASAGSAALTPGEEMVLRPYERRRIGSYRLTAYGHGHAGGCGCGCAGGGSRVIVHQSEPPCDTSLLWFDTDTAATYTHVDGVWVQLAAGDIRAVQQP